MELLGCWQPERSLDALELSRHHICVQVEVKDAQLAQLRSQFGQLKDDFLHNEGVLRERDAELEAAGARIRHLQAENAAASLFKERAATLVDDAQTELALARQRCALDECTLMLV